MIRKLLAVAAVASLLGVAPAIAAPACKDAKGKFIRCPPAAHAKGPVKAKVVKGKDGKCRIAAGARKGQFTKC